jgi:hypothetical protein
MATVFTLTPQPVRVTATGRQQLFLATDMSGYDALDVEVACMIEGTSTNAQINLVTGMQIDVDDGWVVTPSTFPAISGSGQQFAKVTIGSGMLQFIRWDVSSMGGASAITFFIRGIARQGIAPVAAATLASSYAAGLSTAAQTMTLSAGNGSQPTMRWDGLNGTPTGQVAGLTLTNTTLAANGAQQFSPMVELTGQGWQTNTSGSQTVKWGLQTRPVQGAANPTGDLVFWQSINGGAYSETLSITGASSSPRIKSTGTDIALLVSGDYGFAVAAGLPQVWIAGAGYWQFYTSYFIPVSDFGGSVGLSNFRVTEVWSRRYAGVEQTIAAAATITLNPASGETIRITLSATAITTINGSAGYPGEVMRVEVIQDGTGSRSISGWSTGTNGFKLAGGAYTVTATANKRDVLTFLWDNTDAKWVEQSRSMNC